MSIDMKDVYASEAFNEPYCNRQTMATRLAGDIKAFQEAKDKNGVETAMIAMVGRCVRASMDMDQTKCITKGCENHRHEGVFEGELCGPCAAFVKRGESQGQAWRNAVNLMAEKLKRHDHA